MKILLVHNFYQYRGGEDIYIESLFDLLKSKGHAVQIYAKNSSDIRNNLSGYLKSGMSLFDKKTITDYQRIIHNFQPDIIQFQNLYPLLSPLLYKVSKQFKIPIVQRISNYRLLCPKGTLFRKGKICDLCVRYDFKFPSIIYKCYHQSRIASAFLSTNLYWAKKNHLYDFVDLFIFPSKFTQDVILKNFPIKKSKTAILPTFNNISKYKSLKLVKKDTSFLYFGRLSEEKGIINLLKMFSQNPSLYLKVIGDGELKKQVDCFKQFKNISYLGFLPRQKIAEHIEKSLAVIIPGLWHEVLPNTLIEAFALGTLIIVPATQNFKTLIVDKKTGFLYKPGDYSDLIDKLKWIRTNRNLLTEMTKNVLKEYNNKYSDTRHYQLLVNYYKQLQRNN